ncbi:Uncharacterized protein TCM_010267 [Theobroma cacao]|uniref:Uncharacterized protein n=1 Tax=Theobroma cacao TaxID=3641 RepID=A0A061E5U4_THECC|nr:Uncharacterized protein TCM_010267 [Theobroma cacao]
MEFFAEIVFLCDKNLQNHGYLYSEFAEVLRAFGMMFGAWDVSKLVPKSQQTMKDGASKNLGQHR